MIFVDSSVFLKHFLEGDRRAFEFLRSSQGMVTSDIVVNEVLYILMKQYVENKYDLRHYDAIKFLKDPDKFDESFNEAAVFLKLIEILDCTVLPNVRYSEMIEIMRKFNLLPNDAIIAATCKAWGITRIATFDADLKGIGFLNSVDL